MSDIEDTMELIKATLPLVGVVIGGGVTYMSSIRVKRHELKLANKQMIVQDILIPLGKELEKVYKSETMEITDSIREIEKYISVDRRIYLNKKMRTKLERYIVLLNKYDKILATGTRSIYYSIKQHIENNICKNGYDALEVTMSDDFKEKIRKVLLQMESMTNISLWDIKDIYFYTGEEFNCTAIDVEIYELEDQVENGFICEEAVSADQWFSIDCHKELERVCDNLQINRGFGYDEIESEVISQYQEVRNVTEELLNTLYKSIDKIAMY
ncbi:hypothetical protein PBV87_12830 [Niameybacter massiliensis]|uniref:Uncharacterized protein n=1 Tax=Holtiella tumoricola TaxID=3018743 RepID=A0AA42DPH5_9FIRM|nr:hypothetical protein [Holtiella tumoricola]MDA3732373.1 hypothetical protein [Holtiella tumoricola]